MRQSAEGREGERERRREGGRAEVRDGNLCAERTGFTGRKEGRKRGREEQELVCSGKAKASERPRERASEATK